MKFYPTKRENDKALQNIEIIWKALTTRPILKARFGTAGDPRKYIRENTMVDLETVGVPGPIMPLLFWYPPDHSRGVPTKKEFESDIVKDIGDAFSSPKWSEAELVKEFFLREDIPELLNELEGLLKLSMKKEEKENESLFEEDPDAPLNRIAFAPLRLDLSTREKMLEPNNKKEEALYKAFSDLLAKNIKLEKKDTDFIKDMMKQGLYEKIFKGPSASKIYRGMVVSEEWLRKALGLKEKQALSDEGSKASRFVFTPRTGDSSSWTLRPSIGKKFSGAPVLNEISDFGVLLTALTDDNPDSFLDLDGIYNLKELSNFRPEGEIIGLGDIKVSRIMWIRLPKIKKKK